MDEKGLITLIAAIACNIWRDEKQPLLISNIPRHLADTDFRSVLGDEGIKSFVSRTRSEGGYKLVEDPGHKARVGIIPAKETFEFPTNARQPIADEKHKGEVLLRFLDLVGELSDEEQRSVVIPANVIAKLLRK